MKPDYEEKGIKAYLGDCLEVMPYIEDNSVDAIITDLPYGTTACKWDAVIRFEPMWEQVKRLLKKNGTFVTTASQPFTSALIISNTRMFKYEWIWEKNRGSNFATTKYQPMKEHENVLVFCDGTTVYNPIYEKRAGGGKARALHVINPSNTGRREALNGMEAKDSRSINPDQRVPRSIQKFNTEVGKHPTQKPVALYEYLIKTYTNEEETVLDFTAGSFTTGVACIKTKRNFIGIEKEEKYFEIGKERMKKQIMEDSEAQVDLNL